jgi:hypothetical protein
MGIDLRHEQVVAFSRVPGLWCIPYRRKGRPLHVSTIYRWHLRGIGGICLEAFRVGGTLCTSVEALQRFFDRLAVPGEKPERSTSPTAANRAALDARLDSMGVTPPAPPSQSPPA